MTTEHGAIAVAEVAKQPPQALRAAERAVGDHERAGADPGACRRRRERLGGRKRMPASGSRRRRQVALHVEERRAGDVTLEVGAPPERGVVERPAAIHEPVLHL